MRASEQFWVAASAAEAALREARSLSGTARERSERWERAAVLLGEAETACHSAAVAAWEESARHFEQSVADERSASGGAGQ